MKFYRAPITRATKAIVDSLSKPLLRNNKVLWLVSGGSAIKTQVAVMHGLQGTAANKLSNLIIIPVDERFGPLDHENSNSYQMKTAGFKPGSAHWYDVLEKNVSFTKTLSYYSSVIEYALTNADLVIATLGLGPDGHTAGIIPNSPATIDRTSPVVGFQGTDYKRMTSGIAALSLIDEAYVLAYGESKKSVLNNLRANKESFENMPAKLLYDLPKVSVYNDYISTEA